MKTFPINDHNRRHMLLPEESKKFSNYFSDRSTRQASESDPSLSVCYEVYNDDVDCASKLRYRSIPPNANSFADDTTLIRFYLVPTNNKGKCFHIKSSNDINTVITILKTSQNYAMRTPLDIAHIDQIIGNMKLNSHQDAGLTLLSFFGLDNFELTRDQLLAEEKKIAALIAGVENDFMFYSYEPARSKENAQRLRVGKFHNTSLCITDDGLRAKYLSEIKDLYDAMVKRPATSSNYIDSQNVFESFFDRHLLDELIDGYKTGLVSSSAMFYDVLKTNIVLECLEEDKMKYKAPKNVRVSKFGIYINTYFMGSMKAGLKSLTELPQSITSEYGLSSYYSEVLGQFRNKEDVVHKIRSNLLFQASEYCFATAVSGIGNTVMKLPGNGDTITTMDQLMTVLNLKPMSITFTSLAAALLLKRILLTFSSLYMDNVIGVERLVGVNNTFTFILGNPVRFSYNYGKCQK